MPDFMLLVASMKLFQPLEITSHVIHVICELLLSIQSQALQIRATLYT